MLCAYIYQKVFRKSVLSTFLYCVVDLLSLFSRQFLFVYFVGGSAVLATRGTDTSLILAQTAADCNRRKRKQIFLRSRTARNRIFRARMRTHILAY